jgi:multiple antibiotic resistance protein
MPHEPYAVHELLNALLLGFPALFSVVNPIGGAFIFEAMLAGRSAAERGRTARQVAFYSLCVLLVALWLGSLILNFFGVSLAALRCAGGVVIALTAWKLLNAPDTDDTVPGGNRQDMAFFPLTIPVTAGPGSISVAVALSAEHPHPIRTAGMFFAGVSMAAIGVAVSIWVIFSTAHRITPLLGEHGNRVFGRLIAFLLLCIGFQVLVTGLQDVFGPLTGHPVEATAL